VYFLRQLLMFVLVLSLSPVMPELIENIEHIVHDGHLAHFAHHDEGEDEVHAAIEAEHGCTPMNHNCGCHVSVPIILTDTPVVDPPQLSYLPTTLNAARSSGPLTRANAPPVPPPTA
jgi:hypothetical protein